MYYVKIPLRYLSRPKELAVEPERQQAAWDVRIENLLHDIQNNMIPFWATNYQDLKAVKVEEE